MASREVDRSNSTGLYAVPRTAHLSERFIGWVLAACAVLSVFTTVGIVLILVGEALQFFRDVSPDRVPVRYYLDGSLQGRRIRGDSAGCRNNDDFGACDAHRRSTRADGAIYLSEYASFRIRRF